jgi:hypothetical protein
MPCTAKIGILLSDQTNGEPIGLIEFDPSGMLVTRVFQTNQEGLHVYALNPLVKLLGEHILKEPLYRKYAHLLKEKSALPADILEQEASSCADVLNRLGQPLTVGNFTIKAEMVRYSL